MIHTPSWYAFFSSLNGMFTKNGLYGVKKTTRCTIKYHKFPISKDWNHKSIFSDHRAVKLEIKKKKDKQGGILDQIRKYVELNYKENTTY